MGDEKTPQDPVEPVVPPEPVKALSPIEEATKILEEIKQAGIKLEEQNKEYKKNEVTKMLSSAAGGHIKAQDVDPEKEKVLAAAEFFKGTQLEKDILKANE